MGEVSVKDFDTLRWMVGARVITKVGILWQKRDKEKTMPTYDGRGK